ncbi:hypothetical protein ILUMI_22272 [Ignelater luminosus]|uniref:Uncharacterized protein n=1 Tax=Ignelater luminosus TaxID=2038154 RepID=A0A8K0G0N8_IGNLU|nr:hypothetical protein ILUMI_22272 [Ignelater luminosus]
MNKFCVLVLVIFSIHNISIESKIIQCPTHCKCDIFEKYRRATCTNRSLIGVDADIPPQVELLDLSYNQIHELSDHIFVDLNLTSLKLLNLSHNKIGQIHMNAFADMTHIKTIDLSYNNIEYFLENWFWNIHTLEELYFQRNNLRRFREEPILESKSLKILDLSKCSLTDIHEDAFSKLPSLEILNLSENNLIQLNVNVLKPLSNLRVLNLANNTWHCNDVMKELGNYCKSKGIKRTDICLEVPKTPPDEKFQRMVVMPELETEDPKNSWIYEDVTEKNNQTVINTCSNETIFVKKDLLLEIIELSPVLALITPFVFGLSLGLIIACVVAAKTFEGNTHKKKRIPRRSSIIRNRRIKDLYDCPLVQSDSFEVCDTTPVPLRKNIFSSSIGSGGFN